MTNPIISKRGWEPDRYDWASLRAQGAGEQVPAALRALQEASVDEEAERAYWRIDNTVVLQGALYEAALPTITCGLVILQRCTPVARPWILELLVQLGGGKPAPDEVALGNTELRNLCLVELARGEAVYFDLLENGSECERRHCVDLLGLCATRDPLLRERVLWYFRKLLTLNISEGLAGLIDNWILSNWE
jgi:hypothetical protein